MAKTLIPEDKLDFWIQNKANVLLEGKHGIGKTHIVIDAFKKHNLSYAYFSCATLDPWIDFVGVPKVVQVERDVERKVQRGDKWVTEMVKETIEVLKVIPPEIFAFDEVDVIFLDELNRAPPKVRNALMELLQFKSINGRKLKRLKMVWGAINPPPDKNSNIVYDVEELDYAQISRFHVRYKLKYEIAEDYFTKKFGAELTENVVNWWMRQSMAIRDEFPPRNIDYCLSMIEKGGDVEDTLPDCVKKKDFLSALSVRSNLNIVGTAKKGTGVNQRNDFTSISQAELTKMSRRDRPTFLRSIASLTNEEFINMFKRVGVRSTTSANKKYVLVSAMGKKLLKASGDGQLEALGRVRTFMSGMDSQRVKKVIKTYIEDDGRSVDAAVELVEALTQGGRDQGAAVAEAVNRILSQQTKTNINSIESFKRAVMNGIAKPTRNDDDDDDDEDEDEVFDTNEYEEDGDEDDDEPEPELDDEEELGDDEDWADTGDGKMPEVPKVKRRPKSFKEQKTKPTFEWDDEKESDIDTVDEEEISPYNPRKKYKGPF